MLLAENLSPENPPEKKNKPNPHLDRGLCSSGEGSPPQGRTEMESYGVPINGPKYMDN